MGSSPGQPYGGVHLRRNLEHPSGALSGEAADASTSESVGAGKLVVVVGGRHGGFVVPGLLAIDALRGSAQHG